MRTLWKRVARADRSDGEVAIGFSAVRAAGSDGRPEKKEDLGLLAERNVTSGEREASGGGVDAMLGGCAGVGRRGGRGGGRCAGYARGFRALSPVAGPIVVAECSDTAATRASRADGVWALAESPKPAWPREAY